MITQKTWLLANYLKKTANQDKQTPKKETLDMRPTLTIILGLEIGQHKKVQVKLAILNINRMIKIRKFYLLEERQQTQMGKRHWSCGRMNFSKATWDRRDWLEEWEMANLWWLGLINWFLLVNMLPWSTLHKKFMIKNLLGIMNKDLN